METPAGWEAELELSGGMGRARTPLPGGVPEIGDRVCYTTLTDDYQPGGGFPSRDATPWTHGGPPADPLPGREPGDAGEDWS